MLRYYYKIKLLVDLEIVCWVFIEYNFNIKTCNIICYIDTWKLQIILVLFGFIFDKMLN